MKYAPNTVKNAVSVWKYLNKKSHLHISIISVPPSSSFQFHPHRQKKNVTHPPDQWSASLQCEALYMAAMFPCKEWPGPTIKTCLFQGLHPGKLTCWTQKWSFGRWFPFQLGDFSVPAVHFQGCADLSLLPFWTVVYFFFLDILQCRWQSLKIPRNTLRKLHVSQSQGIYKTICRCTYTCTVCLDVFFSYQICNLKHYTMYSTQHAITYDIQYTLCNIQYYL